MSSVEREPNKGTPRRSATVSFTRHRPASSTEQAHPKLPVEGPEVQRQGLHPICSQMMLRLPPAITAPGSEVRVSYICLLVCWVRMRIDCKLRLGAREYRPAFTRRRVMALDALETPSRNDY
jgi:hypothetical protein